MTMTKEKWLACKDPTAMLNLLGVGWSARKHRLFSVACCKQVWMLFTNSAHRDLVDVAAEFADGQVTETLLKLSLQAAQAVDGASVKDAAFATARHTAADGTRTASREAAAAVARHRQMQYGS